MWTTRLVPAGAALLILIFTNSASAQHGPGFETLELQAQPVAVEPLIDLVESAPAQIETQVGSQVEAQVEPVSNESKPLGLPRVRSEQPEQEAIGDGSMTTPMSLGSDFVRMVASLGGILLLIFAMASFYKRLARTRGGLSGKIGAGGRAPAGLVEVLGRYPISSGMTLVVLRFDCKVLLLSHSGSGRSKRGSLTGGGMQTLCELNSPEEVASVLLKVRDESGDSIAASFERTLQDAGNATDKEIEAAMYQPSPGVHVQRPTRRVAPGFVTNDEGDRLELTSMNESPAASQVLRRRLGAMRRGR